MNDNCFDTPDGWRRGVQRIRGRKRGTYWERQLSEAGNSQLAGQAQASTVRIRNVIKSIEHNNASQIEFFMLCRPKNLWLKYFVVHFGVEM